MGSPSLLEPETLPTPHDDDRPDEGSSEAQIRMTRASWVDRFLAAAAEPTSPASINAQREALSMLFPEARVAGVSLVPPLKVGPDFPGSLGLLLIPEAADYPESELGLAIRSIIDSPDWTGYANGLMRSTVSLRDVRTSCALVVARAIDRTTLLRAAGEGL
jgi:hypothetical protein